MKEELEVVHTLDIYSNRPEIVPSVCSLISVENKEMDCDIDYFATNKKRN